MKITSMPDNSKGISKLPPSIYANNPIILLFTVIYLFLILCLALFLWRQMKVKDNLEISLGALRKHRDAAKASYQLQVESAAVEKEQNAKYQEDIKAYTQSLQTFQGEFIALDASNKINLLSIQHLQSQISSKTGQLKEIEATHSKLQSALYSNRLALTKSTILQSNEEVFFLERESNRRILKVIYSSERDGFSPSAFHSMCNDEIKPTFTLYQTATGSRFGAFSTVSFDGNDLYKYDEEAFMFNLNDKQLYSISNKLCAVHADRRFFPSFDGDALFVDSKSGHALLHKVRGLTDGMKRFEIEKIEVLLAASPE